MAFDTIRNAFAADVPNGGSFTVGYPSGRSATDYISSANHFLVTQATTYSAPTDFTVSFGESLITINYTGSTTLSKGRRFALQLDQLTQAQEDETIAYGSYYFTTPAETSIAEIDTPVKAAGATAEGVSLVNFTHSTNRLTYTGSPTLVFRVTIGVTSTGAANNKLIGFYIAKNGTPIDASEATRLIATGADAGRMAVQVDVELDTNDYVELWVANETDTTNFTVQKCNVGIVKLGPVN